MDIYSFFLTFIQTTFFSICVNPNKKADTTMVTTLTKLISIVFHRDGISLR